MFEPSKEQRHIKEVCLETATETRELSISWTPTMIVEAAKTFEAFFYTDPDTNKEKEE